MVKTMVSCRFSQQNQSNDKWEVQEFFIDLGIEDHLETRDQL